MRVAVTLLFVLAIAATVDSSKSRLPKFKVPDFVKGEAEYTYDHVGDVLAGDDQHLRIQRDAQLKAKVRKMIMPLVNSGMGPLACSMMCAGFGASSMVASLGWSAPAVAMIVPVCIPICITLAKELREGIIYHEPTTPVPVVLKSTSGKAAYLNPTIVTMLLSFISLCFIMWMI